MFETRRKNTLDLLFVSDKVACVDIKQVNPVADSDHASFYATLSLADDMILTLIHTDENCETFNYNYNR